MKKLLCVILCVLISCFAITACTGNNPDDTNTYSTGNAGTTSQDNNDTGDNKTTSNGGNTQTPTSSNGGTQVTPTSSDDKGNTSKDDKPTDSDKPTSSSTGGNKPTSSTGDKPTSSTGDKPTSSSDSGTSSGGTTGGDYPQTTSDDLYLSPDGNDSNSGSKEKPLYSLSAAVSRITAGHTIYMMPGTYYYDSRINLFSSGSEGKPITIQAYNWEKVVVDFSNQPYGNNKTTYVGFYLKGNYWKIQGLEICHAGDNGIKVEGSHNYIGRCVLHHNGDSGIQLGFGHKFSDSGLGSSNTGEFCAYNTVENCDSYLNYDFDNWGDADGFACKMHNGKGNVFIGCRAWSNCDDAWDLYETDYTVRLIDCWAWDSAKLNDFKNDKYFSDPQYLAKKSAVIKIKVPNGVGNGNAMKFGGNGAGGSSKGVHYATNCVAFNCDKSSSNKGFDENSHGDGVVLENCVGWDNGYNYMFENGGAKTSFTNCISFYTNTRGTSYNKPNRLAGECGSGGIVNNCSFKLDGGDLAHIQPYLTIDDFISLKVEDAKAPRQADGSLPNNGFARLKQTSSYYGKGMGLK